MGDRTGSLALPLTVTRTKKAESGSIRFALSQINSQRESFRHVTEASLEAEIATSKEGNHDVDMQDSDQNDGEETAEDHKKKVQQAREEMLNLSNIARTEAFHALEFVSFLLSKYRPAQAKGTLSDGSVQRGTMEARSVVRKEASAETKQSMEDVSRGYKLEAFRSSSENLLNAGDRLRSDADAETRYWEALTSLKAQGWAVSRTPGKKDVWAVHFGSSESRPMFRDRGMATLTRAAPNGNVSLDFGGSPPRPKSLKVEILDKDGRIVSVSKLKRVSASGKRNEIQQQVLQARDTLFEEELFLEMTREATILTSYDVVAKPEAIVYPLGPRHKACIRLVSPDDVDDAKTHMQIPGPDKDLDGSRIALVLRLLLSHAHRQNLKRRSQPPPPMIAKPRAVPEYHLIRPLLAYFTHKDVLGRLKELLSNLSSACKIAGIPFSSNSSFMNHLALPDSSSSTSATDDWLAGVLFEPSTATISLRLPSTQFIDLRIRSLAAGPIYEVEYSVVSSLPQYAFLPTNRSPPRLSTFSELETFLILCLNQDILAWVQLISHPLALGTQQLTPIPANQKLEESAMELDTATPSTQMTDTTLLQWEIFDSVEMTLVSNPPRYNIGLQVQPNRVHCYLYMLDQEGPEQISKIRRGYLWSSVTDKDGNVLNMLESVRKGERSRLQMKTLIEAIEDLVSEAR